MNPRYQLQVSLQPPILPRTALKLYLTPVGTFVAVFFLCPVLFCFVLLRGVQNCNKYLSQNKQLLRDRSLKWLAFANKDGALNAGREESR